MRAIILRRLALLLALLLPLHAALGQNLLERGAFTRMQSPDEDDGGSVLDRAGFIRLHRADPTYRLPMECYSACTLLLALPGACVAPGSHLYFHGATVGGRLSPKWNTYAMGFYPEGVRRWVAAHRALASERFTRLDWQGAARLGVRVCE
ncbi:MAG TPA: hypothetical protein VKV77_06735 [Methylovirgula sp.]|nr:hypothetical protein [Methylovirgula sp.]